MRFATETRLGYTASMDHKSIVRTRETRAPNPSHGPKPYVNRITVRGVMVLFVVSV